jgi:hypothetical protein
VASAVSIVPYIGDLAKTAKLPRYIRSVRKAIDIARFDLKWARALRELFAKLKQVFDECSKLAADLLPDAAQRQLKALKDEIDNFLSMKGGTIGKPSGSGKKTARQNSSTTKTQSTSNRPEPTGKVDRKPEKEYGPGKDDGPKTADESKPEAKKKPDSKAKTEPNKNSKEINDNKRTELTGTAKKAKWAKARQGEDGPGLRDHFQKHGDQVGAKTAREYDLSSRRTIQNGRKFTYRDRMSGEPRVGYHDPKTGLFTATSRTRKTPAILSHFPETWENLRKLPGFSVK